MVDIPTSVFTYHGFLTMICETYILHNFQKSKALWNHPKQTHAKLSFGACVWLHRCPLVRLCPGRRTSTHTSMSLRQVAQQCCWPAVPEHQTAHYLSGPPEPGGVGSALGRPDPQMLELCQLLTIFQNPEMSFNISFSGLRNQKWINLIKIFIYMWYVF